MKVIRVHLVTGGYRDSGDASDLTGEELTAYRDFVTDMMMTGPDKGYEVSIDLPDGGWAAFPRSSILYVELVGFGASQ